MDVDVNELAKQLKEAGGNPMSTIPTTERGASDIVSGEPKDQSR